MSGFFRGVETLGLMNGRKEVDGTCIAEYD